MESLYYFTLISVLCAVTVATPIQNYNASHTHDKTANVKGNHLRIRIAIGVSVDITSGESCPKGHVVCDDNTQCIPEYWWCDAHEPADCRDGSDEQPACEPVAIGNGTDVEGFSVDLVDEPAEEREEEGQGDGEEEEEEENDEEEDNDDDEEDDSSSSSSSESDEEISIESLPAYLLDKLADAFEDAAEALESEESSEEEGTSEEQTTTVHETSTTEQATTEQATTEQATTACPGDYLRCKSDGACYPLYLICTTPVLYTCIDLHETINCNCSDSQWASCSQGFCLPKQQMCDGYNNCPDGSDESPGCGANCPDGRVPCNDNSQCIPESYWCDNYPVPDCKDGSDEEDGCVPIHS